jgi:hypothetical protein
LQEGKEKYPQREGAGQGKEGQKKPYLKKNRGKQMRGHTFMMRVPCKNLRRPVHTYIC